MSINSNTLSAMLARVRALQGQAVEIRSRVSTQKFPLIDTDIAVTAGLLAASAMEVLSVYHERLAAIQSGCVAAVVAELLPGQQNSGNSLSQAVVQGHDILLSAVVDQLNKAELMLEGRMDVRGLVINRGELWDK